MPAGPETLRAPLLKPYPVSWAGQPTGASIEIWITGGEKAALDRAIEEVRRVRGPKWPLWACLNDLFDHFIGVYDSHYYKSMGRQYPVLDRDGWRCQAPGCTAHSALHVHHILFRSCGGKNQHGNLVTLCDFHHLAIHRQWIRCWGEAPHNIRWTFGINSDPTVIHGPVARFLGQYRLQDDEIWNYVELRLFGWIWRPGRRRRAAS
ncbi:MAG: hypothetical protein ACE5HV_14170 [Acidobacteriota bacterium]